MATDPIATVLAWSQQNATAGPKAAQSVDLSGQTAFVEALLGRGGISITRREAWNGGMRLIINQCPFNPDHGGSSVAIMILSSGAIVFKCQHESCRLRKFQDVRDLLAGESSSDHEQACEGPGNTESSAPYLENLPLILINNRPLPAVTAEAFTALEAANRKPTVFVSGAFLVRIVEIDGRSVIEEITEPGFRGILARAARYVKQVKANKGIDVPPPQDVVRDLLSLPEIRLQLPFLKMIVEAPTLLPNGKLLATPGYHAPSNLFYAPPKGFIMPEIPVRCSEEDARSACTFVTTEILGDFPFVDQPSRANALAALLTPLVRASISGCVPMAVVDAVTRGTGKSLFVNICCTVATGSPANVRGFEATDEEMRKAITSVLKANPGAIIAFDNVRGAMKSSALERALTGQLWSDRNLGESRDLYLLQRATWFCTGNNVRIEGDLPRRIYWIRMNAHSAHPFLQRQFRHADLPGGVAQNRSIILAALFTMVRAWWDAGRPAGSTPILGGFEEWSRTLGGILEYADCHGFLSNFRQSLDEIENESVEWAYFLDELYKRFEVEGAEDDPNVGGFTAANLLQALAEAGYRGDALRELMPEAVANCYESRSHSGTRSGVGKVLGYRKDRRFLLTKIEGADENKIVTDFEYFLEQTSTKRPIKWHVRRLIHDRTQLTGLPV